MNIPRGPFRSWVPKDYLNAEFRRSECGTRTALISGLAAAALALAAPTSAQTTTGTRTFTERVHVIDTAAPL